jgi:hypothetical protein
VNYDAICREKSRSKGDLTRSQKRSESVQHKDSRSDSRAMRRSRVSFLPKVRNNQQGIQASVVGDIHHQSLAIQKGASFDSRSVRENHQPSEKLEAKSSEQIAKPRESLSRKLEQAEPAEVD